MADVKNINQGIQQVNGQLTSMGSTVSKVGGLVKGLVTGFVALAAVKAVGNFIGDSIKAASDLNETINKSNTIFGENAGIVNKWAQTASTSVGLSRAAALDAAAGFGNMFTQLGFAGDEAANLSTKTVQMAADLGSFNNLPTADVADKISAAFRGEYDSLQSLIPNINAARVEQEAMAATGKTVASELTAQEKATAVLAIVQRDGAAAMGDFARTSDGLANSQKILSAKFEDVKTTIGSALLPIMTALVGFVLDSVIPAVAAMASWFGEHIVPALKDFAGFVQANLLPVLAAMGAFFMDTIVPAFKTVAEFVGENKTLFGALAVAVGVLYAAFVLYNTGLAIWSALTKGYTAVQVAFNAVMAINPFVLIIVAIAALVAALIWAWQHSETFRNIVIGVWEAIKGAVLAVLNWFTNTLWPGILSVYNFIKDGVTAVRDWFVARWTDIVDFIRGIPGQIIGFFSSIGQWFAEIWQGIRDFFVARWTEIVDFVRGIPDQIFDFFRSIGEWFAAIWQGIKDTFVAAWDSVVAFVRSVPGRILDALGDLGSLLYNAGKDVVMGFYNGVKDSWFGDMIPFFGSMSSMIPQEKGPPAKDKVMLYDAGQLVMSGFQQGLEDSFRDVRATLGGFSAVIGDTSFNSPAVALSGGGGTATIQNTYEINIQTLDVNDDVERRIIKTIQNYERQNGREWKR